MIVAWALVKRFWLPAVILVVLVGVLWWVRHGGYTDGFAKGTQQMESVKAQLLSARTALATAQSANANQAATIASLKKANAHWASEADRLADEGLAAVQAEEARRAKAEKEARTWAEKYRRESSKPACQKAREAMAASCATLEGF